MIKKALFWLVVGFLIFYLWSAPREAAEGVKSVAGFVEDVFRSLITFFSALTE